MSKEQKPELSIILPSIRPQMLEKVYDSICDSTKSNFELVIVSPYLLPSYFETKRNVKYVRDFGSGHTTLLCFFVKENT
jgi:glycosyltransferase involved in cell wall biosynthesis